MIMKQSRRTNTINSYKIWLAKYHIILMGDMNDQTGGDRSDFEQFLGPHAYQKCTDKGNHFINFCAMNNLKTGLSIIQNKDLHKINWISNDHMTHTQDWSPGNRTHLADFLPTGYKSIPWNWNLQQLQTGDCQNKDQAKKKQDGQSGDQQSDTSKLLDQATQLRFQTVLQNRFAALVNTPPGSTEQWNEMKELWRRQVKKFLDTRGG